MKIHWKVLGEPACDQVSGYIRTLTPPLTTNPDAVTCQGCLKRIGMTDADSLGNL